MSRPVRLLTIGHSYGVAMNRRLADAFAREGGSDWEVTVAAPEWVATDRGLAALQPLAGERARLVPLPVRWPGSPHLMRYGAALRPLLAENWDVVHCWAEPFVRSAWQVAAGARPGARLVYSTFQNLPKRYPPPFSWGERRAMRRADGWIAFGHTIQETLLARREYAARPHRVIPPPVDLGRFAPDPEARDRFFRAIGWEPAGAPVVGYVGRLVPAKGLRVLRDALEQMEGWRAVIVGDGPLEGEIAAWAARRPGQVRLVGGMEHDAISGVLPALDVLCLPSLTTPRWREQFGRVLIEAMASGVAVLGSDSGEIPHVIGDAGLVVPEGDVAEWVDALRRVLGEPALRSELIERGARRARSEYALPGVAGRHLEFFDALLAGARA